MVAFTKNLKILMIFIIVLVSCNLFSKETDKNKFTLSFEDLLNVKVNAASKKNEEIKDIPASTIVITRDEIELYGYKTLKEVIDNIPGFYVMGNLGVDIYAVRGYTKGDSNNFVILINGMEITDDLILKYYQVPVDFIDRVEVVKGPMAVMYGNSAFFGVINVITNEPLENKMIFSYGSYDTKEFALRMTSGSNDLKMTLNIGYFDTAGMNEPLSKMISEPGRMDEPLFGGEDGKGLGLPDYAKTTNNFLQKSQKTLNFTIQSGDLTFNGNYVDAENYWYYYFPSLNEGSIFQNENLTTSLKYNKEISSNFSFLGEVRYSTTSSFYIYNHLFEEFYGNDKLEWDEIDVTTNFFYKLNKNVSFKFGVEYESVLNYVDYTNVPLANIINNVTYYVDKDDTGEVWSGFLQSEIILNDKLSMTLGLRGEKQLGYDVRILRYQGVEPPTPDYEKEIFTHKDSGNIEWLPRFALIYNFDSSNVLKFLYGKSQKRPSYEKVGDDIMDIFRGEKDGQFVTSEFIETYEINYMSAFADKYAVNFSIFYNQLNDLIFQRSGIIDDILRAWWENTGEMETVGMEGTLFFSSDYGYNAELSFLIQETDDNISKDNASFSPKNIFYFKIGKNIENKYIFGLTAKYISKMEPFFDYTYQVDEQGNPMDKYVGRSSYTVPGYTTVSMSFKVNDFLRKNMCLSLSVSNLLDKEILYPTFSINNLWADKGTVGEGRSIQFKIGYKF